MFSRKPLAKAFAVVVLGMAAAASIGAHGNARHTMYVTFSRPVTLPGVSLGSGTYIFEVPDATGDHNLVRVMSRDRSTVLFTAFTAALDRPAGMKRSQAISLAEGPSGQAPRISVWWPEDSIGRQFIYPTK